MTTPHPYYLNCPTLAQLNEIYHLRVAAWQPNPHFDAAQFPDGLFDALDPMAHHWIIEDEGRIVAAARVAVVNHLADIPNWQLFGRCELPDASPLAYLSRLVILPKYRGRGWSNQFDKTRLMFVDQTDVPVTICWSEEYRVNALQRLGFVQAGYVDETYNFYDSIAYVQFRRHPSLNMSVGYRNVIDQESQQQMSNPA